MILYHNRLRVVCTFSALPVPPDFVRLLDLQPAFDERVPAQAENQSELVPSGSRLTLPATLVWSSRHELWRAFGTRVEEPHRRRGAEPAGATAAPSEAAGAFESALSRSCLSAVQRAMTSTTHFLGQPPQDPAATSFQQRIASDPQLSK